MACDMPKPRKFPSLDSCQKRFLRAHRELGLTPHPVVGLVLQVGAAEKFPQALGFEGLDPFFQSQQAGLLEKLMVMHSQILFSLAVVAIA